MDKKFEFCFNCLYSYFTFIKTATMKIVRGTEMEFVLLQKSLFY